MDIDQIPLIAGHPALDFVNTVEGRGSGTEVNYLADYSGVARWCGRVDLISPSRCVRVLRHAKQHPAAAARAWREAMDLRDCLNRLFRALANGEEPSSQPIAEFNAMLDRAFANRRLLPSDAGDMCWTWREGVSEIEVPIWEIALAAAELMTDADHRGRIKVCANGPCDWMFLDTSRTGRRRWCRMGVCGNASKVRKFRERQRTGG